MMVFIGVLASWLQLRTVFRSVEQVRHTAMSIGEGELNRRVELGGQGQELSDLANGFNAMLDRIQLLLGEMRDVSNHIAHDLRTPVSRIRGVAETSLASIHATEKEQIEAQAEALATIVGESDQLGEMINTMLEIAQTDAGLIEQQQEKINFAIILHEAYELFLPVAEDAGITFTMSLSDQVLPVKINRSRLQRALSNLIDNALKFTASGGHVSLTGEIDHGSILVHIRDDGIGISTHDCAHVFERFYRSDQSRTKPGNGLGLSYAMSIIGSHGGLIEVESSFGKGSCFSFRLPLAKTL
ncbi:MAG: HAMP domain-containing histidine kinase [Mariprofundus sp.]|nr:HAMP domain-containing histidine kinase [Mariprofundus sp.]